MNSTSLVVTIDGPAGSGKSTAARNLAQCLGFQFLDTGAMYRAVAWHCLEHQVDLEASDQVAAAAHGLSIRFDQDRVMVDEENVSTAIRSPEVTRASSIVAQIPRVREGMVALQRRAAQDARIVTEGRDQGTIVFPDAFCKFFLTADVGVRAERRHAESADRPGGPSLDEIRRELIDRDQRDEARTVAPLRPAADAIQIDTTRLDAEAVVKRMEETVRQRLSDSDRHPAART